MTTYTMSMEDFKKMENSLVGKRLTYGGYAMAHMDLSGSYGQYYIYPKGAEMDYGTGKDSMGAIKIYTDHVEITTNDQSVIDSLPENATEVPNGSIVFKGETVPLQDFIRGPVQPGGYKRHKKMTEEVEKFFQKKDKRITARIFREAFDAMMMSNSAKDGLDKFKDLDANFKMVGAEKFMEIMKFMEITYGMSSEEYEQFQNSLSEKGYLIGEEDAVTGKMEIKDKGGKVVGTLNQCDPSPFSNEPPVRYELHTANNNLGCIAQNIISPELQNIMQSINQLRSGKKAKVT